MSKKWRKRDGKHNTTPHSERKKGLSHKAGAKKALGQHFLTNAAILKKIVESGNVAAVDVVLEIGPGRGSLTQVLLESGATVIAIEKDVNLVVLLKEKFASAVKSDKLVIIEGDVLKQKYAVEEAIRRFSGGKYKIISNIPYYITGSIVRLVFSFTALPTTVVLLVQDEVARRVAVPDGKKESILSLSVKAYGLPRRGVKVKAGSFSPAPKVDSAVLIVENVSRSFFSDITEDVFFRILKRAFSQKRKILLNTLFANDKEMGRSVLKEIGLSESVRPENIPLALWKQIILKTVERRLG
jgi:16S rRNA (adenine1518-N6/adenine1519-N6)-dimethyltransferase